VIWQHLSMPVHDVAQRGFGSEAETYDRSRPTYPSDAVAWLVEHLGVAPGARLCDLAAGTGKFTSLLVPFGATLVAVEPVEGMRRVLRRTVPGVPAVSATAEALPFADESLDAITVAQAFHWFDAPVALAEFKRVLRRGGRLGLVWNARERATDWVDKVWGVMDRLEKQAPWRNHERWSETAFESEEWFGPLHEGAFHHAQVLTIEGVLDRFRGVSHLAVLPPEEREPHLDEIRTILSTHPDTAGRDEVEIPYRVDAYWCERRP
jgi:SAM-dependent methyltransferase